MDVNKLRDWFTKFKRKFPWRENSDPYQVWISEIMLQQTRASVVIPFFQKWMGLFPSIETLAMAEEKNVIKAWEGLGYYSRARNAHLAAKMIMEKFQGELPKEEKDLELIPGLGPYTIGAIRSFAFKERAAAVDGNVLRVLSRFFYVTDDIQKTRGKKRILKLTEGLLEVKEPYIIMEALIELGALICQKKPICWQCPIKDGCKAFACKKQYTLPLKTKKNSVTLLERTACIIVCQDFLLLKKQEKGKIMADLWEFPYFEENLDVTCLLQKIESTFCLKASYIKSLSAVKHYFTRFQVHLFSHFFLTKEKKTVLGSEWISVREASSLPFSSGHRKLLNRVFQELKDVF